MTLGERIAEQHRRAYFGEAWHGPSVFEILDGVSASRAAARPIPEAHSIWELVLHLTSWERIVRSRLVDEPMTVNDALDWPALPATLTAKAWDAARAALHEASEGTHVVLARMTEEKLLSIRPGVNGTYEELAHGQLQHALYHAGQMAALKKSRRAAAPAARGASAKKPAKKAAPRRAAKRAAKPKATPKRRPGRRPKKR